MDTGADVRVTIRLFATLREGRFDEETRDVIPGTTAAQLMRELAIPEDAVTLVFVNGRHRSADLPLNEGDEVGLFPPIGGG